MGGFEEVECVCVKGSLVLVLVLGWTQCLPQGVGAPPAVRPEHTNHEQAVSVWCSMLMSTASSFESHVSVIQAISIPFEVI